MCSLKKRNDFYFLKEITPLYIIKKSIPNKYFFINKKYFY